MQLNGFEVDFYFRDLGLVVETDGHEQVRYEPDHVRGVLRAVAAGRRNS